MDKENKLILYKDEEALICFNSSSVSGIAVVSTQ